MRLVLILILFVVGMIITAVMSLIDAALVNWMVDHTGLFLSLTYGDWFWLNWAIMMPVGSAVGYGVAVHDAISD